MIEDFVNTLLAPVYEFMYLIIPIFIIIVAFFLIFYFYSSIKLGVKNRGKAREHDYFIPYFDEGDINYVFEKKS